MTKARASGLEKVAITPVQELGFRFCLDNLLLLAGVEAEYDNKGKENEHFEFASAGG